MCMREEEMGGGAGNFPLLVAVAVEAGSFSTDRGISSARLNPPPSQLGSAAGRGRQHLVSITAKSVGWGIG